MVESLGLSRRLSKDYERLPKTLEPTIYGPMNLIMLGRLVGWREAFCPRQPQLTVCRTRSKAVGAGCGLSAVYWGRRPRGGELGSHKIAGEPENGVHIT